MGLHKNIEKINLCVFGKINLFRNLLDFQRICLFVSPNKMIGIIWNLVFGR